MIYRLKNAQHFSCITGLKLIAGIVAILLGVAIRTNLVHAACAPSTNYGSDTLTVNVPLTSTYRAWSRIMPANASANTYVLEVDGGSCYSVGGGSAIPANAWTWVDYQNGTAGSTIDINLTAGPHILKMVGNAPSLAIDRLVLTADTTCIPTGTGDNCALSADTNPPSVDLTTPINATNVTGTTPVAATANDENGIVKVEFYVDGSLKATSPATPYTYNWDTTLVSNGAHSVTVKAYDAAGNANTDVASVTVQNGDTQPPAAPTKLVATAITYNKVDIKWTASTDNVGTTGYYVIRNGTTVAQLGAATTYSDPTVAAATAYSYQLKAFDAAGNTSAASNALHVTTASPTVSDTTPPTFVTNLKAAASSSSQINLSWTASTDNVGVKDYSVYRGAGSAVPAKLTTVTTTSFGDTGLAASTAYSYYVVANDAAGNSSALSKTVTATTMATTATDTLSGKITCSKGGAIAGATVTITFNKAQHTFTTDSKGAYTITGIPPANYNVRYKAKHYQGQTLRVTVNAKATNQNVTLRHR